VWRSKKRGGNIESSINMAKYRGSLGGNRNVSSAIIKRGLISKSHLAKIISGYRQYINGAEIININQR